MSALNSLPSVITSPEQLAETLDTIRQHLDDIDLPRVSFPKYTPAELTGAKIGKSLQTHIPAVVSAIEANIEQSKPLGKVVGGLHAALTYLQSPAYRQSIVSEVVNSQLFAQLLDTRVTALVDQKVDARLEEIRQAEAGETARPGSALGEGLADGIEKMRKPRDKEAEAHTHWVVNTLIHRNNTWGGLTVSSPMKDWPLPVPEGFVEEQDDDGVVVKRWRPDWSSPPDDTPFEKAVFKMFDDELKGRYNEGEIRTRLQKYFVNVARRIRETTASGSASKGEANAARRMKTLADNMNNFFVASSLNVCADRAFYLAMINSKAFELMSYTKSEPHPLPAYEDIAPDGYQAGYDGFQQHAELWEKRVVDSEIAVAMVPLWWSDKAKFAFWLLAHQSRPKKKGAKQKTPLFHIPTSNRSAITLADLPPLPAPPIPASSSASGSKKRKIDPVYSITRGMVHQSVLDNPEFAHWVARLPEDPTPEDGDRLLPQLDDVLREEPAVQDGREARRQMKAPVDLALADRRSLWRVRSEGTDEEYLAALRAPDIAAWLREVDIEALGADLYA